MSVCDERRQRQYSSSNIILYLDIIIKYMYLNMFLYIFSKCVIHLSIMSIILCLIYLNNNKFYLVFRLHDNVGLKGSQHVSHYIKLRCGIRIDSNFAKARIPTNKYENVSNPNVIVNRD